MYQADYLNELMAHCRKEGVLMIADEVFTGFGRTGPYAAAKGYEALVLARIGALSVSGGMVTRDGRFSASRAWIRTPLRSAPRRFIRASRRSELNCR